MPTKEAIEETTSAPNGGLDPVTYKNLKDQGYPVCDRCKGKLRTDLDHNPYCPINDQHCPRMPR